VAPCVQRLDAAGSLIGRQESIRPAEWCGAGMIVWSEVQIISHGPADVIYTLLVASSQSIEWYMLTIVVPAYPVARVSNHVEFESRVRVRVSSNFLPLTSTKTVELPN